jgi:PBP1b-binding outer membrane lipoprotein LpoB
MILINKIKILFMITIFGLLFNSCSSVQKAFDPERKNSSDEFLIEKKSPLSMPPDFEKLPLPQNKQTNDQNQSDDIETLITNSQLNNNEKKIGNTDKELEESIIDKIKSN